MARCPYAYDNTTDICIITMRFFQEMARVTRRKGPVSGDTLRASHEDMLRQLGVSGTRVESYINAMEYPVGLVTPGDITRLDQRAQEKIGKLLYDA